MIIVEFFIHNIIHIANVMYLLSYLVRDILWLRLLTIVAGSCSIGYYFTLDQILWEPVAWNSVFILINVVQTVLLIQERRPVKLAGEELQLYQMVFRSLSPREFKKLVSIGHWKEAGPDENIAREGEAIDQMIVIYDGEMDVLKDGQKVASLNSGHFIGEMSFMTGDKTSADVVSRSKTRFVSWPFEELRAKIEKQSGLKAALEHIISEDLVRKLKAA